MINKGQTFVFLRLPVHYPVHKASSEGSTLKGSTLKGKNLLPKGSKFFPVKVDPFSEEMQNNFIRVVTLESVSLLLTCWAF